MVTTTRFSNNLIESLCENTAQADFFQTICSLMREVKRNPAYLAPAKHEDWPAAIRLKTHNALTFAPGSIHRIKELPATEDRPAAVEVFVSFLGLTGQNAALPDDFTELILERLQAKDTVLADYFDIFNQRILQLFYEVWKNSNFSVAYEQAPKHPERDKTLNFILSLLGLSASHCEKNTPQTDHLIYYSGLIAQQRRSVEGLQLILTDYFALPVQAQSFTGEWLNLTPSETTRLTRKPHHNCIGVDSLLGRRIWHLQNHFSVILGPLNYQQFHEFLPCFSALHAMRQLINQYVGPEFTVQITLLLKSTEVPPCIIDQKKTSRLGWNTWLKSKTPAHKDRVVPLGNDFIHEKLLKTHNKMCLMKY